MRRRALLIGLTALPSRGWAAEKKAVASFSVLADMTRHVTGGLMPVASLVGPDMDAHIFQPKAADSRALTAAAVLVENGLGLEGWIARLATAAGFKGKRIVATAGVKPRTMTEGAAASIDPHAWQDPRNGVLYVRNIADGLAAADPANAETYSVNASRFVGEIERTDRWIEASFFGVPPAERRIVTTHDAFGYYGDRYGVTFLAANGLSTDAEPSARAIAALVAQIKREKVRAVFPENMSDPRLAAMLARETGAVLAGPLYSDALSGPDGPAADYQSMLRHNTTLFLRAVKP